MIAAIIRWSVANRFLVVLAAVALAIAGVFAMRATPVDALPDLSDTQVIIRTSWPGQAPQIGVAAVADMEQPRRAAGVEPGDGAARPHRLRRLDQDQIDQALALERF